MSGADSDSTESDNITVTCKTCGARLDERLKNSPREEPCPDCHRPVRIPGRDEIKTRAVVPPSADPGVYALRQDSGDDPEKEQRRRKQRDDRCVLVICGTCQARLHPPMRNESYRVRCPDCHQPVKVPSRQEVHVTKDREEPPAPPLESVGTLLVPDAPERKQTRAFFDLQTAQIRREAIDPPPEWVWFSSVWSFPWEPSVLKKWGFISLGLTMLGGVVAVLAGLLAGVSTPASAVMAFFALPMVWIFLWTAAYASIGCRAHHR